MTLQSPTQGEISFIFTHNRWWLWPHFSLTRISVLGSGLNMSSLVSGRFGFWANPRLFHIYKSSYTTVASIGADFGKKGWKPQAFFPFLSFVSTKNNPNITTHISPILLTWKLSWLTDKSLGNQRDCYTTAWVCAARFKMKTALSY